MKRILIFFLVLFAPALVRAQNPGLSLVTGTINAQASTCQPSAGSAACVFLQTSPSVAQTSITISGTFSATLQFEWSPDGGTTWVALSSTPNGGGTAVTSTTSTGVWVANTGGASFVRVRGSAYTSGVATVTLNPSQAAASSSSSGSVSFPLLGTNGTPGAPTYSFSGATNAGLFYNTAGSGFVGLAQNGTAVLYLQGVAGANQGATINAGNLIFGSGKGQHVVTQAANNDLSGTCTAAAATTCVVTFTTGYTSAPACTASDATNVVAVKVTPATGSLTITTASSSSDTFDYVCHGNPN